MPFATKILVSTDFSEQSEVAFGPARELAEQFGAEVHLIHVHDPSVPLPSQEGKHLASAAEADSQQAKRLTALVAKHFPSLEVKVSAMAGGQVAETMCRYAEEHGIDLIVIATLGITGLKRLLLGSTTETVVRHAPCPVLTVRVKP